MLVLASAELSKQPKYKEDPLSGIVLNTNDSLTTMLYNMFEDIEDTETKLKHIDGANTCIWETCVPLYKGCLKKVAHNQNLVLQVSPKNSVCQICFDECSKKEEKYPGSYQWKGLKNW